jgi:hypothetical protein
LITLANWPTVLIDFVAESIYKVALGVPVIGGAFMVALLMGADIQTLLADGVMVAADRMLVPLGQAPIALLAFWGAFGLVAFAGAVVMFIVKSGTLAVLVQGERTAGEIQRPPIRLSALRTAAAYTVDAVLQGAQKFQRRAALLAAWLGAGLCARRLGLDDGRDLRVPVGRRIALGACLAAARGGCDQRQRCRADRGQPDLRPDAGGDCHR